MSSLKNRRILITRASGQTSELASRLQVLGAIPILIPTIQIAPPSSKSALDAALTRLLDYDWLVFTSANAVEAFNTSALAQGVSFLTYPRVAVIGPATAHAAALIGLRPTLIPTQAIMESLTEDMLAQIVPGERVLLVRGAAARDHLLITLRGAGVQVTAVDAYQTLIPASSINALEELFASPAKHPDAVTFTSSSTATNLLTLLGIARLTLPDHIVRASIGPITSQTLRNLGLPPHVESRQSTVQSLASALEGYFASEISIQPQRM